jgi:hypothetical protein
MTFALALHNLGLTPILAPPVELINAYAVTGKLKMACRKCKQEKWADQFPPHKSKDMRGLCRHCQGVRTCKTCGKELSGNMATVKMYCDETCKKEYYNQVKRLPAHAKCPVCDTVFDRGKQPRTYCSSACKRKAKWKREKTK